MGLRPRSRFTLLASLLLLGWVVWCVFLQFGLAASARRPPQTSLGQPRQAVAPADFHGATHGELAAAAQRGATAPAGSDAAAAAAAAAADAPPPSPCAADCHALEQTELPGDVVRWGAGHRTETAAACCDACRAAPKCNQWVWCGGASCAEQSRECWLKRRDAPWQDADVLTGRSSKWTSGIMVAPPSPPSARSAAGGAADEECDFGLLLLDGLVRLRLRREAAPHASEFVDRVLSEDGFEGAAEPPPLGPAVSHGLRFYRAEPVPPHWGSLDWPDNYFGGRWGPPYALLQGHLRPSGSAVRPATADTAQGARPVIRRGMVAWAGGGGGPDFFIALAAHPEWGNGHTVFAEVVGGDMAVIDAVMRRPLRVSNWGSINATELVVPMPFRLLTKEGVARRRQLKLN